MPRAAAKLSAHPLLVGGIEHKIKRRLKPARDFSGIRGEGEVRGDQADNRRHLVAGDGAIGVGLAEDRYLGWVKVEFLMGFAKRGLAGSFSRIDPSPREGDLTGVRPQVVAANGENQPWVGAIGDCNQDGGRARLVIRSLHYVARQQVMRRVRRERTSDSVDQGHGTNGKKAPSDQTPGGSWDSSRAISASS